MTEPTPAETAESRDQPEGADRQGADAPAPPGDPTADEPPPKLPRAPLLRRLNVADLIRIGMFASLLVAVIMLRKPCADGVSRFLGTFEAPADAGPETASEADPLPGYELISAEEYLAGLGDAGAGNSRAALRPGQARAWSERNDKFDLVETLFELRAGDSVWLHLAGVVYDEGGSDGASLFWFPGEGSGDGDLTVWIDGRKSFALPGTHHPNLVEPELADDVFSVSGLTPRHLFELEGAEESVRFARQDGETITVEGEALELLQRFATETIEGPEQD